MKKLIPFIAALTLYSVSVFADLSLEDAKSRGLVGEDASGYIAAVSSPTREVRVLVSSVNDKRRAEYERIADSNNISLSDVEVLAGKKAIEKTASGNYIRLPGGDWEQK